MIRVILGRHTLQNETSIVNFTDGNFHISGSLSGGARQLGQQHPLSLRRSLRQTQGENRHIAPPPGQCHQGHHHSHGHCHHHDCSQGHLSKSLGFVIILSCPETD